MIAPEWPARLEVVKVGHRPRLQMLVTDAWLLVAAIILRLEERPAPRGTGLPW